ncbi:MAG: hypothetical protein JXB39_16495 [Deltaproteobacteria bacterium]|nr:hypothetical protein [Deltaproteobacteria bacterium]
MRIACLGLLVLFCLPACDGQEDDSSPEADTDSDVDADTDVDAHEGWRNPCCLDCHGDFGHRTGYAPYECAPCHGTNGAPPGHGAATPCGTCHGLPHTCPGSEFPDPSACQACHPG